jgi:hypothetical protein
VSPLLVTLAAIVAIAAALRSTWSPCGVSMLSTIVPLTERGRGHRWGASALWFILGSTLGGLTLGLLVAPLAAGIGALDLTSTTTLGVAALLAVVAVASDLGVGGFRVPGHTRQVNEDWLGVYRPWVYAGGFGWQIGVGLATYTVTAGVYLTMAFAALTGSPLWAVGLGTVFGLTRGLMVLLGARLDAPDRLRAFHRRFEELREPSRRAMVAVQAVVAAVAAGAAWGPLTGVLVGATLAAGIVASLVKLPARAETLPRPGLRTPVALGSRPG